MTAQLINGKETALALREALAAELAQKGASAAFGGCIGRRR